MAQIKRPFLIMAFCSFAFGLLGSLVGHWFWEPQAAVANSSQKALAAGELRLTDDNGRTRMLLTLVRGQPRLFMLDTAGEYRLEIGLGEKGEPHIWLRDQDGAAKVQARLTAEGLPSFVLVDQKGRDRAVLGLGKQGEPALIMKDAQGKDRLAIWQTAVDSGLALADENGRPLGALTNPKGQGAKLSFFNNQGQAYWEAP